MKKEKGIELEMKQTLRIFKIRGVAPLIVNNFNEKSRMQLEDISQKKSKKSKQVDPEDAYMNSLYFLPDGKRTGFPAVGFKAAMTRAGKLLGYAMTDSRGMFHVLPDKDGGDLIEIKGKHRMRTDYVRVGKGGTMLRYRAEYPEWEADVPILLNEMSISTEQVAQILHQAGFSCGIGEWRPEKSNSGRYGLFELVEVTG